MRRPRLTCTGEWDHRNDPVIPQGQLSAAALAGSAGLTARFTLAFGPWPSDAGFPDAWSRRTLVASSAGRFRHSSLSALDGAGYPLDQPSFNSQADKQFPPSSNNCRRRRREPAKECTRSHRELFVDGSESGTLKILNPAISGNPSAASGDANIRTEAGTSPPITRSIALGLTGNELDFRCSRRRHCGSDPAAHDVFPVVDCDAAAGQIGQRFDFRARHQNGDLCGGRDALGHGRGGGHLVSLRSRFDIRCRFLRWRRRGQCELRDPAGNRIAVGRA